MTNPPSVASLDVAKVKRVDSIEAMLRKHMQMYDWTRSEARAINGFILTVREGVAEDVAGALAAENERLTEQLRVQGENFLVLMEYAAGLRPRPAFMPSHDADVAGAVRACRESDAHAALTR